LRWRRKLERLLEKLGVIAVGCNVEVGRKQRADG
jgi:hypothetical protein